MLQILKKIKSTTSLLYGHGVSISRFKLSPSIYHHDSEVYDVLVQKVKITAGSKKEEVETGQRKEVISLYSQGVIHI